MNRFKTLSPRLGLVVAGVAIGLIARQVFGPPAEDTGPKLTIDRPIADDVKLDPDNPIYVPINVPVDKLTQ